MKKILIACTVLLTLLAGCGQAAPSVAESPSDTAAAVTTAPPAAQENVEYEYETREIWVENNGEHIYGKAYIPVASGKCPLILTSHGLGANHESGGSYAKKYASRGFAVYTWDFRGGSNPNNPNKSDGSNLNMSVMTEVSDVEAVLNAAKTWDFVDTDRIFLQGSSQGGLVTAIAGMRRQDEIAGLVLLYPAFGMASLGESYSDDLPEEIEFGSMTVGKPFFKDMVGYSVHDDIANFAKPVVIIQGSEDGLVTPADSEEAAALYPNAEYHLIKGAGHGFSGAHHNEATLYALRFLYKHV